MACVLYVTFIFCDSYFSLFASCVTGLGGRESELALTGISNGAMPVGYCCIRADGSRNSGVDRIKDRADLGGP